MGSECCSVRRYNEIDEESFIIPNEFTLGYYTSTSLEIEITFKRFKRGNALSFSQFREAAHILKLNIQGIQSTDTIVGNFYSEFLVNWAEYGQGYDLSKLVTLGVLLGKSQIKEQAIMMFEQFDQEATGIIGPAEFARMLDIMISIWADYLPRLASQVCNKDKLKRYTLKLLRVRQAAIKQLVNSVFGEASKMTKEDFANKFLDPELQVIFAPSGMRFYLYQIFETTNAAAFDKNVQQILKTMASEHQ